MKEIAIITGADGGMGRVTTKEVLNAGYEVVMACHHLGKAMPVYEKIKEESNNHDLVLLELNLASFASIQHFVEEIKKRYTSIKLLLNNAGTLCHAPAVTENNYEKTVGVNYLGHYLLTHLLKPLLGRGSRVVNMVSLTYRYGKIKPTLFVPVDKKHFNRFRTYSDSKLAFFYFTMDAAETWKEEGITVNCADPGIVNTKIICMGNKVIDTLCNIFYRPLIKTPAQGAATMIMLALSPEWEGKTGRCCANKKETIVDKRILYSEERKLLRELTNGILQNNGIVL